MGSTGEVRSRAWICGFSSTAKTAAFAGGARYRPTTSRILSISSGSGEILKSSARHGCSPNARQMRCTLDGEIPTRLASSRLDQCVAPSGTSSSVRTTTSSTWASLMVRGTPGRGSSPSPSSRLARKRVRHFLTVARLMPSRAATAILGPPSAQAKTIRARSASPCAVFRRFAQFSSVRRSASDSTSGSSLVSPMPPADRGPTASSPPSRDLKQNTTHVVMRKPKTGTLAGAYRKRHLGEGEEAYTPGAEQALFLLGRLSFGIAICAESGVDYPFDEPAAAGARVIFLCAAPGLYGRRTDEASWRAGHAWWESCGLADARRHAARTGSWVALATQAGSTADEDFPGIAALVDPAGEVVARLPDWQAGTLVVSLPRRAGDPDGAGASIYLT